MGMQLSEICTKRWFNLSASTQPQISEFWSHSMLILYTGQYVGELGWLDMII